MLQLYLVTTNNKQVPKFTLAKLLFVLEQTVNAQSISS